MPLENALRETRGRLLGAERGYATDAAWREALADVERLELRAAAESQWSAAVSALELRGLALSHIAGDHRGAIALLRQGRAKYGAAAPAEMRRLYLAEAQILARAGDPVALRRLMAEFRESPFSDAAPPRYAVGEGRDTPLVIERPRAAGENSLTLTAMSKFLRQAAAAPGAPFPDFEADDLEGRRVARSSLVGRGAVVLFWVAGSPLWPQRRDELQRALARRRETTPLVLAICQDLDAPALRAAAAQEPLRNWRHLTRESAADLAARLGLFGEAEIFVLDREARIVARGAWGAELSAALDRATRRGP